MAPNETISKHDYKDMQGGTKMDFGDVLKAMKMEMLDDCEPRRFARTGWNGKGMFIFLVQPDCPMKLPYIAMYTATGQFVPWLASQTDMLADDWNIC